MGAMRMLMVVMSKMRSTRFQTEHEILTHAMVAMGVTSRPPPGLRARALRRTSLTTPPTRTPQRLPTTLSPSGNWVTTSSQILIKSGIGAPSSYPAIGYETHSGHPWSAALSRRLTLPAISLTGMVDSAGSTSPTRSREEPGYGVPSSTTGICSSSRTSKSTRAGDVRG